MKHVTEPVDLGSHAPRQGEPPPRTYVCHSCRDQAYILTISPTSLGYTATHSSPCTSCLAGAIVTNREAADHPKRQNSAFINRLISESERERISQPKLEDEIPI